MSRTKIKPCPYCGEEPNLEYFGTSTIRYFYACNNINCPVTPTTAAYKNKGSATRAWNKRYTKDIEVAIAKKIFDDLDGKVVTRVVYKNGHVIWEPGACLKDLKKKYGVIK